MRFQLVVLTVCCTAIAVAVDKERANLYLTCGGKNLRLSPPSDGDMEIGENFAISKEGTITSAQMAKFEARLAVLEEENVDLKSKLATIQGNSGGSSSATSPEAMPECTNATSPTRLISTYNSALDSDLLQSCSRVNGEAAWRPFMQLGGLVIDTADPSAFAAAVNSGLSGLYALTVGGGGGGEYAIDVPLTVHPGQDVRIVRTGGGAGDPSVLAFHNAVTVQAGGALTVDGSIKIAHADTSIGLWSCTIALRNQGNCTLTNGVTVEQYDGTIISVAGTLPGVWIADLNNGAEVGKVARAEGATDAATWAPVGWHPYSYDDAWYSSKATPNAVTNKRDKQFVLFLMPQAMKFTYDTAGYNKYAAVCAGAGLKMVISGASSYFEQHCGGLESTTCIPLPYGGDENGQYWGTTSNVDDNIRIVTGWDDFVIHAYNAKLPYNYPDDASGWETPKRPVCGIEL